jgi:hypothetical protein
MQFLLFSAHFLGGNSARSVSQMKGQGAP